MEVFFYGLFMNPGILSRNGIPATHARKAQLHDYALKIGNRASLIPSEGAISHGILVQVEETPLKALYAEASVADYVPEEVTVRISSGEAVQATCYNLPADAISGTNPSYAAKLFELAKKLDFPDDYCAEIHKASQTNS